MSVVLEHVAAETVDVATATLAASAAHREAVQDMSLRAMVAFEQLAWRSSKEQICASCGIEHGEIPQGPTSYCHVAYYLCSECHEHYNGPDPA